MFFLGPRSDNSKQGESFETSILSQKDPLGAFVRAYLLKAGAFSPLTNFLTGWSAGAAQFCVGGALAREFELPPKFKFMFAIKRLWIEVSFRTFKSFLKILNFTVFRGLSAESIPASKSTDNCARNAEMSPKSLVSGLLYVVLSLQLRHSRGILVS